MGSLILIADVAERLRLLDIRCGRCPRHGRVSMARLVRELGAHVPIYRAWEHLNADCPHRESYDPYRLCDLHAPGLAMLATPIGETRDRRRL